MDNEWAVSAKLFRSIIGVRFFETCESKNRIPYTCP